MHGWRATAYQQPHVQCVSTLLASHYFYVCFPCFRCHDRAYGAEKAGADTIITFGGCSVHWSRTCMAVLPIYIVSYIVLSISANRTTEASNNASLIVQANQRLQGGVGRPADPHQRDHLRIHWRHYAVSSSFFRRPATEAGTPLQCHP